MNFKDIKFGRPYEEKPQQATRIFYFFIKKKGSKILYAEVKNFEHENMGMITTFEVVSKKDWEDKTNLFSFLIPVTIPMYYYRSILLEIFEPRNKPEWQSLRRSLRYF
jgi:hypothetical protein